MATPRRILGQIDGNVRRTRYIAQETRDQIVGMVLGGATRQAAASFYNCDASAVTKIMKKYNQTGSTKDKSRSGRPPVLSLHQKKIIYRKARAAPKIEYKDLNQAATVVHHDGTTTRPPSTSTTYRYLKQRGLTNCRCKKRPKLNRGHALKRLQFAREYRSFPWHRRPLKFSDECSVEKGSGHNQEWCFRFPWEKWDVRMIQAVHCHQRPRQMVWGSIWLDTRGYPRRSKLVIMERDPDAKRGGYSSNSYIKALREGLLPRWRQGQLFMQDNASIHTSGKSIRWMAARGITPIEWPAYSPDLNPIEHLWWRLKKMMHKQYPQYNNLSDAQEEWEGFCEALKACWRAIPGSLIKKLILSMPRRLAAVRRARGYQTKY
jgi:transposase